MSKYFFAVAFLGVSAAFVLAADNPAPKDESASIAKASDAGEKAMARFQLAPGLQVSLFAAEPDVVNPVAINTDEHGRWYVVETFRLHAGVTDIRGIMSWLDEDLACKTVEDRLAMHKRHVGEKFKDMSVHGDRVHLLEDRDGDGKVDYSTIFADGFNAPADGLAASVLPRKGNVWLTDLPNLWLLKDTHGDGRADVKKSLQYGYGVRVGFLGHDLHGLRFGPDGKLYFSIGDRGLNVKTERGPVTCTETGAVLRCNPDGTELELFATGLRNPQDLSFDQYGNLFTGDNNCDHGDPARWVYVVEGSDNGWRVGYQHMSNAGPWNNEKLWAVVGESKAAYLVPPIAHIAAGPSGLAYYPGTGLPEKYNEHFLLVDFRGGTGSGIHSFKMQPHGAGFDLVDRGHFIWEILATDVKFGVDGGAYVADWVAGWGMPMKGRIYRVFNPEIAKSPLVLETKKLIGEGMERRSNDELAKLLGHADIRIRQEAQFELADRGEASIAILAQTAKANDSQLARIHAIWALGQIGRKSSAAYEPLLALQADRDSEICAQAAKVLGEGKVDAAYEGLVRQLSDAEARPKFFAAIALGKLGRQQAIKPILEMLRINDDKDPYLRHAGVLSLARIGDVTAFRKSMADLTPTLGELSPAIKLAVLLALRRMEGPEVAGFLGNSDPAIVLEAARAINDVPINAAMPDLARLIKEKDLAIPVWKRVLNAHFRLGEVDNAVALATFAARGDVPDSMRVEALSMLAEWARPSGRDRVVGLWRPIPPRDQTVAQNALLPILATVLKSPSDSVRIATLKLVEKFGTPDPVAIFELAVGRASNDVRAAALLAMAAQNDLRLHEALRVAMIEGRGNLRREAIRLQVKLPDAAARLEAVLDTGSVADHQAVLGALALVDSPAGNEVVSRWMDKLLAGKLPAEVQLDLLETAAKNRSTAVREKLKQFEARRRKDDPLANYRETLLGGDAQLGKRIFKDRADVSCIRCHKVDTDEAIVVGPDLRGLSTRKDREYILESIVFPNKQISPGFENVIVKVKAGKTYSGMVKADTETELTIDIPDKGTVVVKKSDLISRQRAPSSMPEELIGALSKRDLRDLVEFLATLK
jgi:quinoprotein glucose dehydrogenase